MIKGFRGGRTSFALMYLYNSSSPILFKDIKGGYEKKKTALFKSVLIKRTQNLVFKDKTFVFQCIQNR